MLEMQVTVLFRFDWFVVQDEQIKTCMCHRFYYMTNIVNYIDTQSRAYHRHGLQGKI